MRTRTQRSRVGAALGLGLGLGLGLSQGLTAGASAAAPKDKIYEACVPGSADHKST